MKFLRRRERERNTVKASKMTRGKAPLADDLVKRWHEDPENGSKAIIGLGKDPSAVPVLSELLKKDQKIRLMSAVALKERNFQGVELKDKILCLILLQKKDEIIELGKAAVPALIQLSEDRYANVRNGVVEILGEIARHSRKSFWSWIAAKFRKDPINSALPVLIKGLKYDLLSAPEALAKFGKPAVPALVELLENGDSNIKRKITIIFGWMEDSSATSALVGVLNDEDSDIRGNAVWALGQIKDRSAAPALVELLRKGNLNPIDRRDIIKSLGRIGDHSATHALIDAFCDENLAVQVEAVEAFRGIGRVADPALTEVLQDQDRMVRWHAESALERTKAGPGPNERVEALLEPYSLARK
jgi:HEAT repeat protein